MFLKLTRTDGKEKIYNTRFIRSIIRGEEYTVIDLDYGNDTVKERPEEIMEMLKGSD